AYALPTGVVAILLAAPGVTPGRLQVAALMRADPHPGPGRGDGQRADAREHLAVFHPAPVRQAIAESVASPHPADAGPGIAPIQQAGARGMAAARGVVVTAGVGAGSHRRELRG